jgi:hypothetical protein
MVIVIWQLKYFIVKTTGREMWNLEKRAHTEKDFFSAWLGKRSVKKLSYYHTNDTQNFRYLNNSFDVFEVNHIHIR